MAFAFFAIRAGFSSLGDETLIKIKLLTNQQSRYHVWESLNKEALSLRYLSSK